MLMLEEKWLVIRVLAATMWWATLGHFLFGHFAFHSHTDDCLHSHRVFFELGARALSFGTREVAAIRRELQAPNPQDILDSITCWLNSLWLLDKLDNSIGRIASQAKVPAATRCSALASWHDLTVVTTFGHYCWTMLNPPCWGYWDSPGAKNRRRNYCKLCSYPNFATCKG